MANKAGRVGLISAGLAAALCVTGSLAYASASDSGPSTDAGSSPQRVGAAPHLPASAHTTGGAPAAQQLHLGVNLQPRDPQALSAFINAVTTPGSPLYHHYLAKGQFAGEFGPTKATIDKVTAALRAQGLTPGHVSADGLTIPVSATVAQASKAFATTINSVKLADGRTTVANTQAPSLPADVASVISGVTGLADLAPVDSHVRSSGKHGKAKPIVGRTAEPRLATARTTGTASCPSIDSSLAANNMVDTRNYYSPAQLASAYGLSTSATAGQGQTIAVYELESVDTASIATYQSCMGTKVPFSIVPVGNAAGNSAPDNTHIGVESALDIEDIIGLAPGAAGVIDYEGQDSNNSPSLQNELDVYQQMVTDDKAQVLSSSWGLCEGYTTDAQRNAEANIFAEAAAQGQTVVAAAGDSGSSDCFGADGATKTLGVDDPASQPYVTGVGGTTMTGSGGTLAQKVWNNTTDGSGIVAAGGGGVSGKWPAPAFQGGVTGQGTRSVPDVSAVADPRTGYLLIFGSTANPTWSIIGGTSGAAPTWAALVAQANSSAGCQTNGPVGYLNPALYDAARSGYAGGYYDIRTGDNGMRNLGQTSYAAAANYDLASGLGTPKLGGLVSSLCGAKGTAATGPGTYHALSAPTRFLNTYTGYGQGVSGAVTTRPLPAYGTEPVRITGQHGVPSTGVTSVVLDVTVASVGGAGQLTVYPDRAAKPATPQLSWPGANRRISVQVTVPVPADGVIDLYSNATIHMTADVMGYYSNATGGAKLTTVASPTRLLDTRHAVGVSTTSILTNKAVTFQVTGRGGVPSTGVSAVVLNLGSVNSTGSGYFTAYAGGATRPGTTNLSWMSGGPYVANQAVVPVSSSGTVSVYVTGTSHVVADVQGYYSTGAATQFTPVTSTRLFNSQVAAGSNTAVTVVGKAGVPTGAKYALVSLTSATAGGSGSGLAYATGGGHASYADWYWLTGQTTSNEVLVPLSSGGQLSVYSSTGTRLQVDLQGYYK
ncbi:S53 family peptidase [Streptacidiphilus melanogenes]|uniref:S53 family peptidase n=1 Tax=Streptacidiphilus melanogenes TaxID=411235 RepID=UPI0005A868BC|nr:S53 family peptidase [Streptacidiphilus melanogenes]